MTTDAAFKVLKFTVDGHFRYVAIAWNYDRAVLLSTIDCASYSEARRELDTICDRYDVNLRWFDGEYEVTDGFHALLTKGTSAS